MTNPFSQQPRALESAAGVKLMIFDVDGVLTDGQLHLSAEGELFKSFNSQDGHGLKLLAQTGIMSAIITGRTTAIVAKRAAEVGIQHCYQNSQNKLDALADLLHRTGLTTKDCGYMGDDWPDIGVLAQVSFAACPAQAHIEVRTRCHYIAQNQGGQGAVREVCDLILRAQGHYSSLLSQTLG